MIELALYLKTTEKIRQMRIKLVWKKDLVGNEHKQ